LHQLWEEGPFAESAIQGVIFYEFEKLVYSGVDSWIVGQCAPNAPAHDTDLKPKDKLTR